ncbi:MAG: hypothetical protein NTV23_05390 [Propionibacteriales bacterium]|nr:hypothetical protein [Propionibacteriales bacterium]
MAGTTEGSFSRVFFRQMLLRIGLVLAAMLVSYGAAELGGATGTAWGPFVGGLIGLVAGVAGVVLVLRRLAPA